MEEWKSIPGYETLYEASNEGQIRTCEGKITRNSRFEHRVWKQRILKQKCTKNQKGRYDCRVSLWKDGREKTWLVSRLVAMAFCDGYSEGFTVNHIDGNPLNNRAENLEWCSLKENIQKGFEDGLYCRNSKQIMFIAQNGEKMNFRSVSQAARFLGKSKSYITDRIQDNEGVLPEGYRVKLL